VVSQSSAKSYCPAPDTRSFSLNLPHKVSESNENFPYQRGGDSSHTSRIQSQDLALNMRDDLKLLNRKVLDDVRVYSSSEKRVKNTASIFANSLLGHDVGEEYIEIRKDLLDDSNAASELS
jgi:hypothetical protein